MAACNAGKMIPYIPSILWDLHIPQEAATLIYKDNDGCTAMGNAQEKPTPRTRHIDIKYFSLCDWVERDLVILDRIDTSIIMADHLTKALQPTLFHQHTNFLLGHIPLMYSPVYQSMLAHSQTIHQTLTYLFPNPLPPLSQHKPQEYMHLSKRTITTIHG